MRVAFLFTVLFFFGDPCVAGCGSYTWTSLAFTFSGQLCDSILKWRGLLESLHGRVTSSVRKLLNKTGNQEHNLLELACYLCINPLCFGLGRGEFLTQPSSFHMLAHRFDLNLEREHFPIQLHHGVP